MALNPIAVVEQRLVPEGMKLVAQARAFLIIDATSMVAVDEHRRACKAFEAEVERHLGPIRDAQHKAHKLTVAKIQELCGPAREAASIDGSKLAAWDQEQTRMRREAEVAQQRERERLETAERQRVAEETARLQREEEDRRLELAAAAEARGDMATAARIVSAPIEVAPVAPMPVFAPPVTAPEVVRPEGTSYQTRWSAELVNFGALLAAAIAGTVPIAVLSQVLMFNGPGANAVARSTRGTIAVPGVKFMETRTIVQRGP